jgi:hypothetical protein
VQKVWGNRIDIGHCLFHVADAHRKNRLKFGLGGKANEGQRVWCANITDTLANAKTEEEFNDKWNSFYNVRNIMTCFLFLTLVCRMLKCMVVI